VSLTKSLVAGGPADDFADELSLFGRLVGEWRVQNSLYAEASGEWTHAELTWVFGWIIGGRGIQDVLVDAGGTALGTTVRTWDDRAGWRVVWFCPRSSEHVVLGAERRDDSIELNGVQADGRRVRWVFSDVGPASFRWDGWCSNDDGRTWWHEQHMKAERIAG
jgi:hypothetical protein